MESPPSEGRKPVSFVWLFVLSLAFYATYFVQACNNPLLGAPLIDGYEYDAWAAKIASGHLLWDRVGNYLPMYPVFLALLKLLSGGAFQLHFAAQGLLHAWSSALVASITATAWSDRRAGWIAGVLHATNWMFVIHAAELYAETFALFFLYVTVYVLLVKRSAGGAFAAGIAFAISAGARQNLFLLAPWVCFWFVGSERNLAGSRKAVLFGLGVMLLVGPVVARNYELTGKLMLNAKSSWVLYSGIAPEINGLNPQAGVQFDNFMRMPIVSGARSEVELQSFWAKKVRKVVREQPAAVAHVLLRKIVIFLTDREWSKEFEVYDHRAYSTLLRFPWPGMGLLASLGLAGCLFCRKGRDAVLLLGLLVLSIASIAMFKVFGRYRMPCEALLIPFAAWALAEAGRLARLSECRRLGLLAAPAVLVGIVSFPDWLDLKDHGAARNDFLLGQYLVMQGRVPEAEAAYRASMEKWPSDADSALHLARIEMDAGRTNEAERLYREALHREPDFPEAQAGLAEIYFHRGDTSNAAAAVDACLAGYPNYVQAWQIKAWLAQAAGNSDEEIACYGRAIAEGGRSVVYFQMARRLAELGRPQEARAFYKTLIAADNVDPADKTRAAAELKALPAAGTP